jgi:hypothetical protein
MNSISQAYSNALLADATYALGVAGQPDVTGATGGTLQGFLNNRMTPTLATYIGANYTVVTHIETSDVTGTGFDATVWKNNSTGKLTVSMQGTTGLQDFLTDADLAVSGNARNQVVNLVNWWLKITTPAGQSAKQIQLETVYDSASPPTALGTRFVAAPSMAGSGLVTAADLAKGVEVNGHSLGGYLARHSPGCLASRPMSRIPAHLTVRVSCRAVNPPLPSCRPCSERDWA